MQRFSSFWRSAFRSRAWRWDWVARLSVLAVVLASVFSVASLATAQGNVAHFVIDQVDASKFPQIAFRLRAVDSSNNVVSNLTASSFAVFESDGTASSNVASLQVAPFNDGPVNLIYLLDQGQQSNYSSFGLPNIRQVFTTLKDGGFFHDGVDTVRIMGRQFVNSDQTVELLGDTQQGGDIAKWAANFNFERGRGATKALLGVEDAVNEMARLVPVPGAETAYIILITRFIEEPNNQLAVQIAPQSAKQAADRLISLNVFHLDQGGSRKDPLVILANGAFGQYAQLLRKDFGTSVGALYKTLDAQRQYYTVVYTSTLGANGQRQIFINTPLTQLTCATTPNACYSATVQPPQILIVNDQKEITRKLEADGETLDPNSLTINVDITWPDGHPRPATVQLFRSDDDKTPLQTEEVPADESSAGLKLDISDLVELGKTIPVEVRVEIVDSLGLTAEDNFKFAVVNPAAPTAVPSATPSVMDQVGENTPLLIGGAVGVVVLLLIVVVVVAIILRPKSATPVAVPTAKSGGGASAAARPAGTPAGPMPAGGDMQNTLIAGVAFQDKVLATLEVLEGPKGMLGERLSIIKGTTIIGRNPQKADVVFYPEEESSVSRVHCTVQLDSGVFKLTDNGSSSGTRVNGRRIPPNDPVALQEGDEIVLGDLGKRGIKLRFSIVSNPAQLQQMSGSAEDRTFIYSGPSSDYGGGSEAVYDDSKWSDD